MTVGPEINNPSPGGILLIGRDPGKTETEQGQPFVGRAGSVLNECLGMAGLPRRSVNLANIVPVQPRANDFRNHSLAEIELGCNVLKTLITKLRPNLVIALGNESSRTLVGEAFSPGSVFQAKGIQEKRGYFWWSSAFGCKVLSTLHPALMVHSEREQETFGINNVIGKMLLTWDLQRAKEQAGTASLDWPKRKVEVISDCRRAQEVAEELGRCIGPIACDIEIRDEQTLACVGFAPSDDKACVFTEACFQQAFELLENPKLNLVFHNGQFDIYFLSTRNSVQVRGTFDDTIISWHTLMPEMAGQAQGRGSKRTAKSLKFLASLYTLVPWWKDYEFTDDSEMYHLNGIDCCVTHEIHHKLQAEHIKYGIPNQIYRHELRLVPPVVDILARGIKVDEGLRQKRLQELEGRLKGDFTKLDILARPLLEQARDKISRPGLFWKTKTCPCCRNGASKLAACWSCAGFDKSPSKGDLVERFGEHGMTKNEMVGRFLRPCTVCAAQGAWETFEFNPLSNDQKKILLYEVLGLPKKYTDGKLSVSEDKVKALLGGLP